MSSLTVRHMYIYTHNVHFTMCKRMRAQLGEWKHTRPLCTVIVSYHNMNRQHRLLAVNAGQS